MRKSVSGLIVAAAIATSWATTVGGIARAHDIALSDLYGGPEPVTIYLHRGAQRVESGSDDASKNRSSTVRRAGLPHVDLPAFSGDDEDWAAMTRCVEAAFSDFDVTVVDQRPGRGDYIMAHIGGTPDQLGYADSVGGIAPYNGKLDPEAVVFVFQRPGDDIDGLCVTAAHEVGHALGLDHTRECDDIMSYEDCGLKEFKDAPMLCGEREDRFCGGGESSQNSWRRVADAVGLRTDGARDWRLALGTKVARHATALVTTVI